MGCSKNFLKVIVKASSASGTIGVLLEIAFQLRISCQSVQNFSLLFSNIILAFGIRKQYIENYFNVLTSFSESKLNWKKLQLC